MKSFVVPPFRRNPIYRNPKLREPLFRLKAGLRNFHTVPPEGGTTKLSHGSARRRDYETFTQFRPKAGLRKAFTQSSGSGRRRSRPCVTAVIDFSTALAYHASQAWKSCLLDALIERGFC